MAAQVQSGQDNRLELYALGAMIALATALSFNLGYSVWMKDKTAEEEFHKNAYGELNSALIHFDQEAQNVSGVARNLSQELSMGTVDFDKIKQKLSLLAAANRSIYAVGLAFAPNEFIKEKRLVSAAFVRDRGGVRKVSLEQYYDYTATAWFRNTLAQGAQWHEPFLDPSTNTIHVRYAVPFYRFSTDQQTRVPLGVVFVDVSLENIITMVEKFDWQYAAWPVIISAQGTILYHQIESHAKGLMNIVDLARIPGEYDWEYVSRRMLRKESGVGSFYNTISRDRFDVYYEVIPSSGWSLALMVERKSKVTVIPELRQMVTRLACAILILIVLLWIFFALWFDIVQRLWTTVVLVSVFALGLIGFIWHLDLISEREQSSSTRAIKDNASLRRFMVYHEKINQQSRKKDIAFIPTNLYISNLDIGKGDLVTVQGLIWQRYNTRLHENMVRGLKFPNAISSTMTEEYRIFEGDEELIGWRFKADFAGHFKYLTYPLDKQTISMRLIHKDFNDNVVLIPDFKSWDLSRIQQRMGLSRAIDLVGWDIEYTYFSYQITNHDNNFGIEKYVRQKDFPEMDFTVELRRSIVNPLVSALLPIIVVLFLVFSMSLVAMPRLDKATAMGTLVRISSSILFSTVVAHQRFRASLPEKAEINYMEYFYFLTYAFILIITINCLIVKLTERFSWLRADNNVLAKSLYWPMVLVSFVILTLKFFY